MLDTIERYLAPTSLERALAALAEPGGVTVLAGGTDLLDQLIGTRIAVAAAEPFSETITPVYSSSSKIDALSRRKSSCVSGKGSRKGNSSTLPKPRLSDRRITVASDERSSSGSVKRGRAA